MFSTDIEIVEKNGTFSLSCCGEPIECLFTTDLVQSKRRRFIEYIASDFDRCGNLDFKDKKVIFKDVNCAYNIYSIQKLKIEKQDTWSDMLEMFRLMPKYDYALIQTTNGPPFETEETARLQSVRKVFRRILGQESFELLTSYVWGAYYQSMDAAVEEEVDAHFKLISDEDFQGLDSSKKIVQIINKATIEQKAALSALCEVNGYKSLILPIAVLNKWISKNEYISAIMVVGGGILDLSGNDEDSTDSSHQELYLYHKDIVESCLNYCDDYSSINTPSELESRISKGENVKAEFKQTFTLDTKTRKREKYIMDSCIKTIAGFLNSEGGELLIGVRDDGAILGIREEVDLLYKNNDKFLLNFKDNVRSKIGEKFFTLIDYHIVVEGDKEILEVVCAKSDEPIFVDEKDFYVRVNPATEKIEGKELINYVKTRFSQA